MRRRTVLGTGMAAVTASLIPRTAAAEDTAGLLLDLLHDLRRNRRLPDLHHHPALTEMARLQAMHMHRLRRITHTGTAGSDPAARGGQAGYGGRILGEALAETRKGPEETMNAWLAHEETRDVLLDPEARHVGVVGLNDATGLTRWDLVLGA